jgi:putative ABC transport system permease protein
MNLQGHLRDALTNLYVAKLRSLLAVLGILIGTASVVAMVSGGELATRQALNEFKALGTDLLAVTISQGEQSNETEASAENAGKKLSPDEVLDLKDVSPDIIQVAPYINVYANATFASRSIDAGVLGVTEDFFGVAKLQMLRGRFVRYLDKYSAFCVVGSNVYEQLKGYALDPIGEQINLGGTIFTIIGALKPWQENSFIYASLNDSIFIPIEAATVISKYADISNIVIKLTPQANIEYVIADITKKLETEAPGKKLYFQSAKQFIKGMEHEREILTIFLGLIGSIALVVGGIGIMNIMLVSVTERRREIGIRLAIGAKRRDIQMLFLVESVTLALFGGICGVLIGILISYILALSKGWEFTLFFMPPAIGFGVSVCIGIFFGFYPAYKASKLDPIETLRSE